MSKVSIIIPVYNGAEYLPDLLDSVIGQTSGDWDCICVNDGSSDDSLEVLNRYASKDSRITVIDQPNGGCGTARNTAMQRVTTPFVTFADQDDILHPQAFEIAVNAIESSGVDCLCFGFSRFLGHPDFPHLTHPQTISPAQKHGTALITGRNDSWSIFVWQHVFRTAAVKDVPFPPVSGGEDQAWMSELSWRDLSWASIPSVLYANRKRPDSQSRGISNRYIDCVFTSYDWIRQRARRHDVPPKWLSQYIRHMAVMFTLSVAYRSPGKLPYALGKLRRCLLSQS